MATLEQIQAKMKKLQVQAEALAAKKAQGVVDKIREIMLQHGLTTADIEAKAKSKRAAKAVEGSAAGRKSATAKSTGGKVAPKYRDPKTGAEWTGRGRAPAWIVNTKNRAKFLIADASEAVGTSSRAAVTKVKSVGKKASKTDATVAGKGQPKGEQPAKYRDPKSGATWSGRGRAPAWLASVKDRSRFLIDGGTNVAAAIKTSKPKSTTKKTIVEKAVTTKTLFAKRPVTSGAATAKKPGVTAKKVAPKEVAPVSAKRASAAKAASKNLDADAQSTDIVAVPETTVELSA